MSNTSNHEPHDWDPQDAATLGDQRLAYDEMREHCPVAHSDFLDWSLFRHDDIVRVLEDPVTFSSEAKRRAIPNGMDAPDHTRYRQALEPYFTPEQMVEFAPQCRNIADELVQKLAEENEAEIVSTFAEPLSLQSHCAFLGWPTDIWDHLRGWTHGNQEVAFTRDRVKGRELALTYTDYVHQALSARRDAGSDAPIDVTSQLMAAEVNGEPLSDDNIVSILRNWTAGHGTVAAAISILVLHLARHPEMQDQFRADPTLVEATIDDILRSDGPLVANRRTTTRDVEINGRSIPSGEKLTLMWIAANRDPRVFDAPEDVRTDRDPETNLLFGKGIHYCIGASLARIIMRTALESLLARTTRIELAETGALARDIYPSNGLDELRIRLR